METNFLFWPFTTSEICIQKIMVETKLTWYWKVRDQIHTIERLWTKLKYGVKDRDHIRKLPIFIMLGLNIFFFFFWFFLVVNFFFLEGEITFLLRYIFLKLRTLFSSYIIIMKMNYSYSIKFYVIGAWK